MITKHEALTSGTMADATPQQVTLSGRDYKAYLQYQAASSSSVTFIAQNGNLTAYLTKTPSKGSRILDSGASNHIPGNKNIFTSLTCTWNIYFSDCYFS